MTNADFGFSSPFHLIRNRSQETYSTDRQGRPDYPEPLAIIVLAGLADSSLPATALTLASGPFPSAILCREFSKISASKADDRSGIWRRVLSRIEGAAAVISSAASRPRKSIFTDGTTFGLSGVWPRRNYWRCELERRFGMSARMYLGVGVQRGEPGQGDIFIRKAVNVPDERARSISIAAAARNWSRLSASQRDTLLDGATAIAESRERAAALGSIGRGNLHQLNATQQIDWAAAVSQLPARELLSLVTRSDVCALNGDAHGLLRHSVESLPPSFAKTQSLRLLGPRR
jgi:hypothetical protein